MNEITYSIQKRTKADTATADKWIATQHITQTQFSDMDLVTDLLRAKQIASNLLKHHSKLLEQNQAHLLNNFLRAMSNGKQSKNLKLAQAYKVMNIGAQINRKLFKANRSSN